MDKNEVLDFLNKHKENAKSDLWHLEVGENDIEIYEYLIKLVEGSKEQKTFIKENTLELRRQVIDKILKLIEEEYSPRININGFCTINILQEAISKVEDSCKSISLKEILSNNQKY